MSARLHCAALAVLGLGAAAPAGAGEVQLAPLGGHYTVPVESMQALRFRGVERQMVDYSCGSAAVATLLSHHYGRSLSEAEVFRKMYELSDKEQVHAQGFSMLDMKRFLERTGYSADGFRMGIERLAELELPAIILLNTDGYLHFVVVKGVREDEVLLGDPAIGIRVMPLSAVKRMRQGPVFLIRDQQQQARRSFNQRREWALRTKPPYEHALDHQDTPPFASGWQPLGDW